MKWPADRGFVDEQRKIRDSWLGPLKRLEPLLKFTTEDFAALQALIAAAQEAEEEGVDIFDALPVNNAPDPSADYIIGYNGDAYRTPFGLVGRSALISSADLAGNASVSISIPTTYQHAHLYMRGMSLSTTANGHIALSEDGGANLLPAAYELFNSASVFAAATADTTPNITPSGGSGPTALFSAIIDIHDIAGMTDKFVIIHVTLGSSGSSYTGSYVFTSTGPVNLVQFLTSTGTFDAGTVELWGVP